MKATLSPFSYGSTVSQMAFTNRERERSLLKSSLLAGQNVSIISPRRWGKSSLVEKVMLEINAENPTLKTVVIDLFSVRDEKEFLELFSREVIKASASSVQDWMSSAKQFFKRILPQLTLSPDPTSEFSISFSLSDVERNADEILDLPENIAKSKKVHFIICIDEFQDIAHFEDYERFEKLLRSRFQRHKNVSYCLYGSKRHIMDEIFNHPGKPFYRFGELLLLGKIKIADWIPFIVSSFSSTGKSISEKLAEEIATAMGGHPWYVQQLAHHVWTRTKKSVKKQDVPSALQEVMGANVPFFQHIIDGLSGTQIQLLKAIASGETQFTATKVMADYKLGTSNNVIKNRARLKTEDIIDETKDGVFFLDPVFELWFRKVFRV